MHRRRVVLGEVVGEEAGLVQRLHLHEALFVELPKGHTRQVLDMVEDAEPDPIHAVAASWTMGLLPAVTPPSVKQQCRAPYSRERTAYFVPALAAAMISLATIKAWVAVVSGQFCVAGTST